MQYKTSLARQIGEALRIQLRGNVLNSAGVYNRSKLTRLVVDTEWDKKVWNDSWQKANLGDEVKQNLAEAGLMPNPNGERETGEKRKKPKRCQAQNKRRKLDNSAGDVGRKTSLMMSRPSSNHPQ